MIWVFFEKGFEFDLELQNLSFCLRDINGGSVREREILRRQMEEWRRKVKYKGGLFKVI